MPRRPVLAVLVLGLYLQGVASAQTADDAQPLRLGPLALTGYLQLDYLTDLDDAGDEENSFSVRRARAQLSGPLTKHVTWAVSGDAATMPALRDAYVVMRFLPAATIRVGQTPVPFGLERVTSSNTLPFTERFLAHLTPARDLGVVVTNARPFFGWLSYGAAVINGTGQNTRDDNRAKDVLLRVAVTPRWVRGLSLAANATRGAQPDGLRVRTGGDIRYEDRARWVAVEYLRETTQDGLARREGFYGAGSWRFYPKVARLLLHHVEIAARYGRLTGDAAPARQWDFAFNYYVQRTMRLMFDVVVPTDRQTGRRGAILHARTNVVWPR